MKTLMWLLALMVLGCGQESALMAAAQPETASASSRALQSEVTLRFAFDWGVTQSEALVKGNTLRFEYEAARIQACTGTFQDAPAWVATAHYVLGDAPERTVQVGGYTASGFSSVIQLDREGPLVVWFEVTNRWGCQWFDSAYGQNYHFAVTDSSTVRFNADWSTSVDGDFSNARAISLEYAMERLPGCRARVYGQPAWDIMAYARFDGGPVKSAVVTRGFGGERRPVPGSFSVPTGAREMEIWFLNTDAAGCSQYDSNWGQNYRLLLPH